MLSIDAGVGIGGQSSHSQANDADAELTVGIGACRMIIDGHTDSRLGSIVRGRPGRVLLQLYAVSDAAVGEGKSMSGAADTSLLDREYAIKVAPPLDLAALGFKYLPAQSSGQGQQAQRQHGARC